MKPGSPDSTLRVRERRLVLSLVGGLFLLVTLSWLVAVKLNWTFDPTRKARHDPLAATRAQSSRLANPTWTFSEHRDEMDDTVVSILGTKAIATDGTEWVFALSCGRLGGPEESGASVLIELSVASDHGIAPGPGAVFIRFDKNPVSTATTRSRRADEFVFDDPDLLRSLNTAAAFSVRSDADPNTSVGRGPVATFDVRGLAGAIDRLPTECRDAARRIIAGEKEGVGHGHPASRSAADPDASDD